MAAESDFSPLASPATPSRRLNKKERLKMISQITILDGTMDGRINVSLKIEDCSIVDDNSLSLLSMPDGPFMSSEPIKPTFHSFVITVQNGQRAYGGSYIFGLKQIMRDEETDEHKVVYISRALTALTVRPLVDQLHKLLQWCVNQGGCNPRWLRCLANIRLPQKGKCIIIHLPSTTSERKNLVKSKCTNDEISTICTLDTSLINGNNEESNSVAIFRPPSVFPLFDYSLRRLLTEVLTIDNLLLVYTCALNELQILIVSNSYYNLMLISECLVALLNPFKWQHVYVPILPTKLGLHYLDAPTPFIMGINSRHRQIVRSSKVACIVDCDNKKIEINVENANFLIPFFIEDLRRELQEVINCDPRLQSNLQQSEALKRVSELAHKYNVISDSFTYIDEVKFNQSIRILFFKKLKRHILNKYQHFIVCVGDKKDQIKFDTVSYLSDQPIVLRPFLQNFVETQMFASFIDEAGKTITRKQKSCFNDTNLAESVYGFEDEYEELDLTLYSNQIIEARFENAQAINLVELEDFSTQTNLLAMTMSPSKRRVQPNITLKTQSKLIPSSPSKQVPSALTSQTNWKVVETLLREVKVKTKRILLAKMGSDETGSSNSGSSVCMFEENSLISALCDLIERIWSHARTEDEGNSQWESSKCPFWSHLVAFHHNQLRTESSEDTSTHHSTSDLHHQYDENTYSWISLKKRIDSLSQLSLDQNGFSYNNKSNTINKQIPSSLLYDFNSICNMTDIKTDVGKSRAFIRLSLERKLLSKHLRSLLYNQELLQTLYKRYAFLRSEEEREQFITHLLTLNAVDLYCFTNTFTTSTINYSLIICSTSSFTGWICINGSLGRMEDCVHIDTNQYDFNHKNFGQIYTLSISVSTKRKVFVEQCFIRNNVTNSLYKFDCGKWLGQSVDDGALERLLIAESVNGTIKEHIKRCSHSRSSSIGRNWTLSSESSPKEEKHSVEDLQTMLGDTINHVMKYYFSEKIRNSNHFSQASDLKPPRSLTFNGVKIANSSTLGKVSRTKGTTNSPNLVTLLFGHKKFLWVITQVFYYGFKNRRAFRRPTFIWDYILRIQCELKHLSANDRRHAPDFVQLIEHITNKASTYGKDMKFQLFILLSLRDHKLSPGYLKLLSQQPLVQLHYENESFLRDANLTLFLTQILKIFNEVDLKLDPYLIKNL